MPLSDAKTHHAKRAAPGFVGVGLRHPHYQQALSGASEIDFIEVHAENFFAAGGASRAYLQAVAEVFPISLHATSLGLGSVSAINGNYLRKLSKLALDINPIYVSDHACFCWGEINAKAVHAGDLLPIEFSEAGLRVLVANVAKVQQALGRQLLVENISAYYSYRSSTMREAEFLAELTERTECGLLVDLNNLLVNAHNQNFTQPLAEVERWLETIPRQAVKEIHLAGYTLPAPGELAIDDHAVAVSALGWQAYELALQRFGPVATLVEWDNELPSWQTLLQQAVKAKVLQQKLFNPQMEASYGT